MRSKIKRHRRPPRARFSYTHRIFLWGVHRVLWPVHRESLIPSLNVRRPFCLARRNERAVNPIVPLNAVVTYAGSKLLTNSRLKFVARERKCARQLRQEAIAHSFESRINLFPRPSNGSLSSGRNGSILIISFFFYLENIHRC